MMLQNHINRFGKLKQAMAKAAACVFFAALNVVVGFAYLVLVPSNAFNNPMIIKLGTGSQNVETSETLGAL